MGKIKIYSSNTRGNVDYKLKKLIRELEPIIERKMITDANFAATFRTATTPEELQRLHSVHCAETATIISETKNESTTNLSNMGTENTNETKSSEAVSGAQKKVTLRTWSDGKRYEGGRETRGEEDDDDDEENFTF